MTFLAVFLDEAKNSAKFLQISSGAKKIGEILPYNPTTNVFHLGIATGKDHAFLGIPWIIIIRYHLSGVTFLDIQGIFAVLTLNTIN